MLCSRVAAARSSGIFWEQQQLTTTNRSPQGLFGTKSGVGGLSSLERQPRVVEKRFVLNYYLFSLSLTVLTLPLCSLFGKNIALWQIVKSLDIPYRLFPQKPSSKDVLEKKKTLVPAALHPPSGGKGKDQKKGPPRSLSIR